MIELNEKSPRFDIKDILAENGPVSKSYPGFELRSEQIEMCIAVKRAMEEKIHLVSEAGTGIGKSFAYLIPAIEAVSGSNDKVLISTYTITLQEQLINKDIPFLGEVLPWQFNAALAKGRGNFVCLRRLDYATRKQRGLFDASTAELMQLGDWARQSKDGSLSDLSVTPSSQLWNAIKSEHGNCRGRKCEHFQKCFYWRNRRRLESANIIIANHALLFSDLVLKEQNASVLPEYRYVIIDEAHNAERVAEDHFGIKISNYRVSYALGGLYNERTKKGILAYSGRDESIELVKRCGKIAKDFFEQINDWYEKNKGNPRPRPDFMQNGLAEPLKVLRLDIGKMAKATEDVDERFELLRYADLCRSLEQDLLEFMTQPKDNSVYWIESEGDGRKFLSLRSAPINVAPDVKRCLFDNFESVIMTSATLSCDGGSGFDFFAGRIGLEKFRPLKLGSPFDYQKQVTIYIETDLPEPNDVGFLEEATEKIKKYVKLTGGKAFVLFTSYSMLEKATELLAEWFEENDIQLLQQGAGIDRGALLELFKTDTNSVLFGTDSFWQGVDVPGQTLSNVIIVRLPFAVPSHPLIQGRIEQIRAAGENPFFKYQLPSAIIKFKQGFGRLIRNKTDRGIVVILDNRIIRKNYGKDFLAAIPKCNIEIV